MAMRAGRSSALPLPGLSELAQFGINPPWDVFFGPGERARYRLLIAKVPIFAGPINA